MPRDKTDTHNKLLPCIKQEFLEHGYEKASMQNIARRAVITAAGIYRHFPIKEAMFTAMVEPVTSDFLKMCGNIVGRGHAGRRDFLKKMGVE